MADSSVPITAGSGTNVDTRTQSGGDHRQVMVVGDPTNSDVGTVFGAGYQRVTDEPHQIFYDPFDAAPDTTNLWTTNSAGGGVAAAVTSGALTVGTGTTTAGYSQITSIPTFKPSVPAWLGFSFAISMTDLAAPTAQTYRFWGAGTAPGSPTAAAPLTDAIGFELATDGKMYAVVYATGSRTVIQDLSAATGNSTQPTNTASHRYGVYVRTDRSYFFIDTLDNVVATATFQAPSVQTLPVKLLAVAGTTPGASGVISCTGLAVWDTGKNAHQISDGTYPFRKATVGKSGGQAVRGASITGQTLAVTAATPVTGAGVDASEAGNVTFVVKNTVAATAYTGVPVIVFEQSDDNVSWAPLPVVSINGAISSSPVIATGVANVEQMFDAGLEGVNYVRVHVTTAQATNGMTVVTNLGGMPFSPWVATKPVVSSTGTISSPALSLTSFTVLASNTNRLGAIVYNDSGNILYLALASGTAASTTAYTVQVPGGGYWELPNTGAIYTGAITGIALVASGNARVTELT